MLITIAILLFILGILSAYAKREILSWTCFMFAYILLIAATTNILDVILLLIGYVLCVNGVLRAIYRG